VKFRDTPVYSFDDVLLVPQHSQVASRQDVDLSTRLGSLELKLPILSANMDTVTEGDMAVAMHKAGGAGVLHRFADRHDVQRWLFKCRDAGAPRIISKGLSEHDFFEATYNAENAFDCICLDVAHGDHSRVISMIERIRERCPNLDIIAGNVATGAAALGLVCAGANIIKVGIGPGSVCSTRIVSGHGMPQLSAIIEVRDALHTINTPTYIIADGGIRYPGDIVKALAVGADAVMLGSLLAATDEAPGERIVEHGQVFKTYRGMASREVQAEKKGDQTPRVEGVSAKVPYRGPVSDTLNNLEAGIRSGLSYSGAMDLADFRDKAEFVVVTGNTLRENHPHIHHPYQL